MLEAITSNDNLVLISGKSSTGKSASLMNLKNPKKVLYLNCEHKKLPFNAKFIKGPDGGVGFTITDPYQIFEAFDYAKDNEDVETIVIDSMTFLMDMFETMHVLSSSNTMKALTINSAA